MKKKYKYLFENEVVASRTNIGTNPVTARPTTEYSTHKIWTDIIHMCYCFYTLCFSFFLLYSTPLYSTLPYLTSWQRSCRAVLVIHLPGMLTSRSRNLQQMVVRRNFKSYKIWLSLEKFTSKKEAMEKTISLSRIVNIVNKYSERQRFKVGFFLSAVVFVNVTHPAGNPFSFGLLILIELGTCGLLQYYCCCCCSSSISYIGKFQFVQPL